MSAAAGTIFTVRHILSDPMWAPLVTATSDEIRAATDRALAETATPEAVSAKIEARLKETPRNWLALDALHDLASERRIALGPDLSAQFDELRAEDHGYLAMAESCAGCAWDASTCQLSQVIVCQAPVALTPLGDVAGIMRAGTAWATGEEVDRVDLALSIIGLGATASLVVTGGGSESVKAGASFIKVARRMGRMSKALLAMVSDTIRAGVDLAKLPGVRSVDDLRLVIRTEAFLPLSNTLNDLNKVREATDITTALHLLPLVDDANDAKRLAASSEALGNKLIGRAEMLGKSRLFRATLKLSRGALGFTVTFSAFLASLGSLCGHALQHVLVRSLKRGLRRKTA